MYDYIDEGGVLFIGLSQSQLRRALEQRLLEARRFCQFICNLNGFVDLFWKLWRFIIINITQKLNELAKSGFQRQINYSLAYKKQQ